MLSSVKKLFGTRSPLEHHLAVFGESGSGKTTLLTSFYGHQQAATFKAANGYSLLAKDTGQGVKLLSSYLRLEEDLLPPTTRFQDAEYDFAVNVHGLPDPAARLVWYDYPGEWWTETQMGEVHDRKKDTFSRLIQSDVSFFLIDGAKFHESRGAYITRLFASFRDELMRHKDHLIKDGQKLGQFPKIWIICMSKADLFDGYRAENLRGDVLKTAEQELKLLRDEIASMVSEPEVVSLGEEFLLLSSASFDRETNRVTDAKKTFGVDLIAPIAMLSPLTHAYRRAQMCAKGPIAAKNVADSLRHLTLRWMKEIFLVGRLFQMLNDAALGGIEKLEEWEKNAKARGDAIEAAMAAMQGRLLTAEAKGAYCGVKFQS